MTDLRPVLVIIAGPNGSGKTTLTDILRRHQWLEGCDYINADMIAEQEFGGWNSPAAVLQAARMADQLRDSLLDRHESLAFETVFSTAGRVEFVKRASANGYFVRLFYVGTDDPAINARRIAQRVREGGHDVPAEKIVSRFARAMENLSKVITIVDRAYVYDNSIDDRAPQLLFRTRDGKLAKIYTSPLPGWAQPAQATLVRTRLRGRGPI